MSRTSIISLLVTALVPCPLVAQGLDCALGYSVPDDTDAAYGPRDRVRCEGVYIRPVSASTRLVVTGFHLGEPDFDLASDSELVVEVAGLPEHHPPGRLIARSMRPRHYYQMDTPSVDPGGIYVWSTEVLRHTDVRLRPRELAIQFAVPGASDSDPVVLWPVRVSGSGGNGSRRVPILVMESESELNRIDLRVSRESDVVRDEPWERPFMADAPIRIPLDVPPGIYDLELTAFGSAGTIGRTRVTVHIPESADERGGRRSR